jgi:hypothetical protein
MGLFDKSAALTFDAERHVYRVDDRELISVTQVIDPYFEVFDADKVIRRMKQKGTHPLAHLPPAEIKQIWDDKSLKARDRGDRLHREIEMFYKERQEPSEFTREIDFLRKQDFGVPFAFEQPIFSLDWGVAGTFDSLFQMPDGYRLVDWKGGKVTQSVFRYGSGPCSQLPDNSYFKYSLQGHLYSLILEREYGVSIKEIMIVELGEKFAVHYAAPVRNVALAIANAPRG